ncbi:MAG: hypothetical protein WBX78_03695, partial [Pseudolabrys sp.]
ERERANDEGRASELSESKPHRDPPWICFLFFQRQLGRFNIIRSGRATLVNGIRPGTNGQGGTE